MDITIRVVGIIPPDEKWQQMKLAREACIRAGVPVPSEVRSFFRDAAPDPAGVLLDQDALGKAVRQWSGEERSNLAAAVQSVGVGGPAAIQGPRSSTGQFVSGARTREHQCPLCGRWFSEAEMPAGRFPQHGCGITVTAPAAPGGGFRRTTVTASSKPAVAPPVQDKPEEMTASEGMKARLSGLEFD